MKRCKNCNKTLKGYRNKRYNTYCSANCQQKFQYIKYIKDWKARKVDGGISGGYVSHHIKRYLFEKQRGKCSKCGWCKRNRYTKRIPLETDHKDGDSTNNHPRNIRLICPNCHSLTPTYKGANKGKGRVSKGIHASEALLAKQGPCKSQNSVRFRAEA